MPTVTFAPGTSDQPSELIFSLTCSEKQVATLLGGGTPSSGPTVTFAEDNKKRERKTGLPSFQEVEELPGMMTDSDVEFSPVKRQSDSLDNCSEIFHTKNDLSPLLSEPIMIPGDNLNSNLSPTESQKNLSRSFEESRPRSLEIETEKDSNNSKGNFQLVIGVSNKFLYLYNSFTIASSNSSL